jgi:hypothetical protein
MLGVHASRHCGAFPSLSYARLLVSPQFPQLLELPRLLGWLEFRLLECGSAMHIRETDPPNQSLQPTALLSRG